MFWKVLEVMRQPLEEGVVRLARANQNISYPASVMLVAAMNPCPCGYHGVKDRTCGCNPSKVLEYRTRISGPMLDRIDITLETQPVELKSLVALDRSERPSSYYRARVEAARDRQRARFKDTPGVFCNAQMGPRQLRDLCKLRPGGQLALENAVRDRGLTARAHDRILKLALSKADLEDHPVIQDEDVGFAIECRKLDRHDRNEKGIKNYVDPRQRAIADPVYIPRKG